MLEHTPLARGGEPGARPGIGRPEPAGVATLMVGRTARVVLCQPAGAPVTDETINLLHRSVEAAVGSGPRRLVLDVRSCGERADSRLVALVCDGARLCRRSGVRFTLNAQPALLLWITVYRLPMLGRIAGRARRAGMAH